MNHSSTALAPSTSLAVANGDANNVFVTLSIAEQLFGVPVLQVQDILGPQKIAHVPLAPPEILGSLNLRGRIVTAIDVRIRLGLAPRPVDTSSMSIVVDYDGELYSLIVDKVSEIMSIPSADYEKNPATLDDKWREISGGIYRLKDHLLVILDVARLLRLGQNTTAPEHA